MRRRKSSLTLLHREDLSFVVLRAQLLLVCCAIGAVAGGYRRTADLILASFLRCRGFDIAALTRDDRENLKANTK